ncbi:hypothetical protein HUA78_32700 [Myxococcus sp. CA033]|uniref:hypothetical protein n=1 Tax=Myxococcus sp. CA033 TaxID=2741516 RepID=UPI00157AD92D|nr:hypothetical protein [Myxococcus sp. CA033]NTX39203.1 hypothetical protein [Myxococcus sp. CA033]
MRTALLALLLSSMAATACSAAGRSTPPTPEDFFRRPDRVQIFLADNDQTWDMGPARDDTTPRSGFFLLPKEGPELSSKQRRALADLWVSAKDPASYPPRKCGFNPDIAFRFWIGKTWVDAVVCFTCREIAFHDASGKPIPAAQAGFLDGFPVMQELAKQAFPEGGFNPGF